MGWSGSLGVFLDGEDIIGVALCLEMRPFCLADLRAWSISGVWGI